MECDLFLSSVSHLIYTFEYLLKYYGCYIERYWFFISGIGAACNILLISNGRQLCGSWHLSQNWIEMGFVFRRIDYVIRYFFPNIACLL
jgi:hypothetical protein